MLNRREFLSTAASTAMAAAIQQKAAAAAADAQGEWRNRQPGLAYRKLGRTGFMVSEVVMGGNSINPGNTDLVLRALDMGLNYLDTAPAYGRLASEQGFGKVIAARKRDSFFLNTKVSTWDGNRNQLYQDIFDSLPEPERKKLLGQVQEELERRGVLEADHLGGYFGGQERELRASTLSNLMAEKHGHKIERVKNYEQVVIDSLHDSLKRLGTDYVDILMCPHGTSTPYEVANHPEIFNAFEKLKKAGKVRHLGFSAHNDPGAILSAAVDAKVYSVAMVAFNIVNRKWVEPALAKAHKAGVGVIAMKVARPVFNGRGKGAEDDPRRVKMIEEAVPGPIKRPQKAYLWALRNANLSAVISDLVSKEIVEENVPLAGRKA